MCLSEWDESKYSESLYAQARAASASLSGCCLDPQEARHLVAVSSFGYVHTWRVDHDAAGVAKRAPRPISSVAAHDGTAYCCAVLTGGTHSVVVTGGKKEMRAWKLDDLVSAGADGAKVTPFLTLRNPRKEAADGSLPALSATRAIAADAKAACVYSAAGDGNAYAWDLATGKCTMTFAGHTASVQDVSCMGLTPTIATASEDGTARVWDVRTGKATRVITPKGSSATKWLGAVASDSTGSWLACGGGSGEVTVHHLASGDAACSFKADPGVHALCYNGDNLMCGSQSPYLTSFSALTGELQQRVPTSSSLLFDITSGVVAGRTIFATCGGSAFVDVLVEPCSIAFSYTLLAAEVPI